MADWKAHKIVDLLVKDEAFVQARQRFARILDISADRLADFEQRYQQQFDSRTFFCNVLEEWKSVTGNAATVSLLANILKENEFVASAGKQ
jgi:hypothetical protein